MLKLFRGINLIIFVVGDPLLGTLTLIMRMRLSLIFVARTDYENILTAKISRFTVVGTIMVALKSVVSVLGLDMVRHPQASFADQTLSSTFSKEGILEKRERGNERVWPCSKTIAGHRQAGMRNC